MADEDLDELLDALDEPTPDVDWATAAQPADGARQKAPASTAEASAAVASMREAMKTPAPARVPPPDLIKAPAPVLHTVQFPVYDRKAGGYRIIERAFGMREIKALMKVLLDQVLTNDRYDKPAALDATQHLRPQRVGSVPPPWRCDRGTVHDTRAVQAAVDNLEQGFNVPATALRYVASLFSSLNDCVTEYHSFAYDRGHDFRRERQVVTNYENGQGHDFVKSHGGFIGWNSATGIWQPQLPAELQHIFLFDEDRETGTMDRLPILKSSDTADWHDVF